MYDVRSIANWLLDRADKDDLSLSNMSINKIIYFIVEKAIVDRSLLITEAKIEAWEHGPVFREIYHAFKNHGNDAILSRATKFDSETRSMIEAREVFSREDEILFEESFLQYAKLTASQLRTLSHQEGGPWYKVWWHEGHINPGMEISADTIRESFSKDSRASWTI